MKKNPCITILAIAVLGACATAVQAEREPVLKQIDLPHPYYYREMYLPQLTSGPSSLAWSPDSRELVYSMAGIAVAPVARHSTCARQLTASVSYDYQPDWSVDGRWIIYSSYRNDAMELWVLDIASGRSASRCSPTAPSMSSRDSHPTASAVAFVSTSFNRHFHIFVGRFRSRAALDTSSA